MALVVLATSDSYIFGTFFKVNILHFVFIHRHVFLVCKQKYLINNDIFPPFFQLFIFIFLALFYSLFQLFFLVIVFGLFHGLVFLPALLGLIGPSAYSHVKSTTTTTSKEDFTALDYIRNNRKGQVNNAYESSTL